MNEAIATPYPDMEIDNRPISPPVARYGHGLMIKQAVQEVRAVSRQTVYNARHGSPRVSERCRRLLREAKEALDWIMRDNQDKRPCPANPCNRSPSKGRRYGCPQWTEGGECVLLTFLDCCAGAGWDPAYVRRETLGDLRANGLTREELNAVV